MSDLLSRIARERELEKIRGKRQLSLFGNGTTARRDPVYERDLDHMVRNAGSLQGAIAHAERLVGIEGPETAWWKEALSKLRKRTVAIGKSLNALEVEALQWYAHWAGARWKSRLKADLRQERTRWTTLEGKPHPSWPTLLALKSRGEDWLDTYELPPMPPWRQIALRGRKKSRAAKPAPPAKRGKVMR